MAQVIKGGQVWYHKYDISGDASSGTFNFGREVKEHRPFSQTAVKVYGGLLAGDFSIDSAMSVGAQLADIADDSGTAPGPITITVTGSPTTAEGDDCIVVNPLVATVMPNLAQGELMTTNLQGKAKQPGIAWGNILAVGTKAASGNSAAGITYAAAAAGSVLFGSLHATAKNGAPVLDVIIQSADAADTGFASPTTRLTFTQLSNTGSEVKVSRITTAITDTLYRAKWTLGGTSAPSLTISVGFGIILSS